MKRKATVVLLVIVMLLPAVIGFISYHLDKNSPVTQKSVTQMHLTDLAGKEYVFEKSSQDLDITDISTNPIRFFMQLQSNATEAPALPEPLRGQEYYKAVYTSYGRKLEYKYYFTDAAEYCYYVDDENRTYKISEEYAAAFLRSEYGMSLFKDAVLPVMTLSTGDVIEPTAISWKYLTGTEVYSEYKYEASDVDSASHTISGALEMNFTIQPDMVNVTVTQDGGQIYDGLYSDIGELDIAVNSTISVTAQAFWSESSEAGYSGEASYAFNATYLDKPVFYLGENSVEVGDFVVLSVKNVSDPSSISFSSAPDINYVPIFFQDGVYFRAFIPISIYAEHPESYVFTCTADGVTKEINLNVSPRRQKTTTSSEPMGDFKTQLSSVFATQTATKYFNGIFTDPFESEKTARIGFYNKRPDANGTQVLHEGYDYNTSSGEKICAVNNGIVLFVGSVDGCGKLVVVDHGFGLMSSYVYLSTVTVNAGDEVHTGDQLGTAGASDHIHLELTVFGHPVDIDTAWKSGVIFND